MLRMMWGLLRFLLLGGRPIKRREIRRIRFDEYDNGLRTLVLGMV